MSNAQAATDSNFQAGPRSELMLSVAMLAIIVVLIVPLPPMLLDMLLAFNLGFSILLLLVTLSARKPMDVAVFPSLLLLTTLFRLSLNVATTRLILLDGNAGKIVSTFGDFIVGGKLIVGVVIFLILVVIQFIVITKGAGRISEVNARFTLDAMPGKQMAIDAELNAGSITPEEAQAQRRALAREAEFFGAMDGAGKYVRGDSIAGLLITGVNLVGGVILGTTSGLTLGNAVEHYSILTIGDGLVSQIPALIIATTAGFLVTKASSESNLGREVETQIFRKQRPLIFGGVIILVLALTPGMPKMPFIILAAGLFVFANQIRNTPDPNANPDETKTEPAKEEANPEQESLANFVNAERIVLEIGGSLRPFVEQGDGQGLKNRISNLRTELTKSNGLWVPTVRIRDMLALNKTAYRISIAGRKVAEGEVFVDEYLALDSGTSQMKLEGRETIDPTFGIKALWISQSQKRRAEFGGYTVVDALTVVVTHLRELIRQHAHELLSREDLEKMLARVEERSEKIVAELQPEVVRRSTLHRVLIHLLEERVPINQLEIILESIVQHGPTTKDSTALADLVREDIGAIICERFRDADNQMRVVVLDPRLEMGLLSMVNEGRLPLNAAALSNLVAIVRKNWEQSTIKDEPFALLVDGKLRRPLRNVIRRSLNEVPVVSYTEVPTSGSINTIALISNSDIFGDEHDQAYSKPAQPESQAA